MNELERRSKRSINSQMSQIIFRMSCCCGLRVSEIADLQLRDIVLTDVRPHVVVRSGKGQKRRKVPLWLDRQTLSDIAAWKALRESQGALAEDSFICHQRRVTQGQSLSDRALQYRFKTLLGWCLAPERVEQLSIHSGRHSFASHLLQRGFTLVQVRDWLGHSSISTTSIYAHIDPDFGAEVLDAFDFDAA
jgi:integrase/recombinase XerD